MALKSDELGFLKGDAVQWGQALKLWSDIRDDIHSLRNTMVNGAAQDKRAANNNGGRTPAVSATPRLRNEQGRFIGASKSPSVIARVNRSTSADVVPVTPRGGGASNNRIRNAAAGAAHAVGSAPDIDPTIAAGKELGAIVAPLGRGFGKLFRKDDERKKNTGWLKRIWGSLQTGNSSNTAFHRAELRRLGEISNKKAPDGGRSSGGILSAVGGLFGKIPGMGGLGGLGMGALKLGGKFLKRLPLLGALFSGGSALASIFGNDDPSKSPEENRKDRFTGGGSGIGALVGGAIGMLGGPVGAMVGGMVGDKVGELIGAWLSTVDWGKVGGQITGAWDSTVKVFSDAWKSVTDTMTPIVNSVKAIIDGIAGWLKSKGLDIFKGYADAANKANDIVKGATGVDVKAGVKGAVSSVGDAVRGATAGAKAGADAAVAATKAGADAVVDYSKTRVERMAAPIGRAAVDVKNWVLGQTSKMFESGNRGAGAVSSGAGDKGGVSYGTYQLSSKMGVAGDFASKSTHAADFAGLAPGSKAFNDKWKEIAKNDPGFAGEQHDYIKNTHFEPQMQRLQEAGLSLSGRGAAVQDEVWSTSVQFGGATSLIKSALKGKDTSKMSDADIVGAVQDYKAAHNDTLFKNSSAKVRAGTLRRAIDEKTRLIALANGGGSLAVANGSVSIPSASGVPAAPGGAGLTLVPTAPDMPSVAMTQTGNNKPQVIQVASNKSDVGQDVSDRRIAHIATAGLSGTGAGS